jgi:hypothetical protein
MGEASCGVGGLFTPSATHYSSGEDGLTILATVVIFCNMGSQELLKYPYISILPSFLRGAKMPENVGSAYGLIPMADFREWEKREWIQATLSGSFSQQYLWFEIGLATFWNVTRITQQ